MLQDMLAQGLRVVHLLPVEGSWLDRETAQSAISRSVITSRDQATTIIGELDFDVFVSVGFPFILPISELRAKLPDARFINVHPSPLPDLRGADPIPGAILHRRDSGVSVHEMDDGIDTGPIITQTRIPYDEGIDARLLYHLCFRLEPQVFRDALARDFQIMAVQPALDDTIYYTFQNADLICQPSDSDEQLLARIRAFNTPRKGAVVRFTTPDGPSYEWKAYDATILPDYLLERFPNSEHNQVLAAYEDCLLIRRQDRVWRLSGIADTIPSDIVGQQICT